MIIILSTITENRNSENRNRVGMEQFGSRRVHCTRKEDNTGTKNYCGYRQVLIMYILIFATQYGKVGKVKKHCRQFVQHVHFFSPFSANFLI